MDRALRLLAILSLIAALVFVVVVKVSPSPIEIGSQTFYQLPYPLFAQTSLLLAVAVGVVTMTVATWRGQYAWVILLLAALLIVAYGVIVVLFYLPGSAALGVFTALSFLGSDGVNPVRGTLQLAVVPALLPLLALTYTWWPHRAPASTVIQASPASPAVPGYIATDRTLRLLAALAVLALLIALSIVLFVAYVASNPDVESQLPLGLWGPLLGQTSYLLAFGVGVAALTDAMRRHQRAWARGFLVTLLVVAYGLILFNELFLYGPIIGATHVDTLLVSLPDWLLQPYAHVNLLGDSFIPALLPLVVLAYSVWRPRTGASSTSEGGERAPSQPPSMGQVGSIG